MIADGGVAARARTAGLGIADALASQLIAGMSPGGLGLASGLAGLVVLLDAAQRVRPVRDVADALALGVDRLQRAVTGGLVRKDACDGEAGVLFALQQLDAIDPALRASRRDAVVRRAVRPGSASVDPLAGLPGVLRALGPTTHGRLGSALLSVVDACAVEVGQGVGIRVRVPGGDGERGLELGRAHGAAGVLIALVELTRTVPSLAPRAGALCRALAAHLADAAAPGAPHLFPHRIRDGVRMGTSSLAWCHGDLSVISALLFASEHERLTDLRDRVGALGWRAPRRERRAELGEHALCHGSAGAAVLLADACVVLPVEEWRDAATEELAAACEFATRGTPRVDEPGMLDGWSGIGLALLELAGDIDSHWRAVFIPTPRAAATPPPVARP